jgi:glutamyl-tRNA synthetase
MAPSPTGALHVGGVRTALFNWLFARNQGGEFLIRIENTDTSREVQGAVEHALESLAWLGLDWDREPTFQLDRFSDTAEAARRLVAEGKAYEDEGAIRFRMPDEGVTAWEDVVKGRIEFPNDQLEDLVLLRSDGRPTYNFASPLEDVLDGITHVIRGDDHISNTPKQIALYRALGAEPPVFAHVPMILGSDGKKLSKRHGATAVGDYQEQGIFPAAMRNFLALLGWSPGGDREIMPEEEMIRLFTLDGIQKKAAVFDTTKLEWMNGQYLSALPAAELMQPVRRQLARMGVDAVGDLAAMIDAVKARSRTILHVAEQVAVRLDPSRSSLDAKGEALIRKMGAGFATNLCLAAAALERLGSSEWKADRILETLRTLAESNSLKLGDVMQPIRVALTGSTVSEPVNELLAVVGSEKSLARIRQMARLHGGA